MDRKDNESSETKIHPPEQKKKRKSRIETYETLKHFAKNGEKKLKDCIYEKKNLTVFQKFNAKK